MDSGRYDIYIRNYEIEYGFGKYDNEFLLVFLKIFYLYNRQFNMVRVFGSGVSGNKVQNIFIIQNLRQFKRKHSEFWEECPSESYFVEYALRRKDN